MIKAAAGITIAALLAGCATLGTRDIAYQVSAPFDEAETASAIAEGTGRIAGSAFLRQKGGGIVTCAGSPVLLIPATKYALERLGVFYGAELVPGETVVRSVFLESSRNLVFNPDPLKFQTLVRSTLCDAQGEFVFEDIKDGEYLITTEVMWQVINSREGGFLVRPIVVKNGKTERLIITR